MSLTAADIITIIQAGGSVDIAADGSVSIRPAAVRGSRAERNRRTYQARKERLKGLKTAESDLKRLKATETADSVKSPPPPSPPPLSPEPPIPAPTPAPTPGSESAPADTRESAAGDGIDVDQVRLLESVLAAYPVNGNASEACRALASLNATPEELRTILGKTQVLAARWRALPQRERRFCPRRHTFFAERRWKDNPDEEPWTAAPAEARGGSRSRPEAAVSTTARIPGYEF